MNISVSRAIHIFLVVLCFSDIKADKKIPFELTTAWGETLKNGTVPTEYPRPQMKRNQWMSLNGTWEFQEASVGEAIPSNRIKLDESIVVPFPWESQLSGIKRRVKSDRAWYRRSFEIPEDWRGKNIQLNFGAVDWHAIVYVNNQFVGEHKGGFDSFSFDITPYLTDKKKQSIIINVYDPTNRKGITVGKQNSSKIEKPAGYTYSSSSGIWQTVWIEPIEDQYINNLFLVPDIDQQLLNVRISGKKYNENIYKVTILDGHKVVSFGSWNDTKEHAIKIPQMKLWSPDNPFLYDVLVEILDKDGKVIDQVESYTGMRKISLTSVNGVPLMALNNEPLFQMGPLDQGYWPDGIYTAPSDEALKWDIQRTKDFGFNMIRKHIKVEPQRWYYWCDKLGILVWQDMPSTFKERTDDEKMVFEDELFEMINELNNHPSIVNWIVFNEHWGLYDVDRITKSVMKYDPSRLVTGNSGIDARKPSIDYEVGHIKDNHSYRPPHVPLISSSRATVNGEYGAIGYCVDGHIWNPKGPWVHSNYKGKEEATAEYEKFIGQILEYIQRGLSAAVYTQWTDVESEMNGIYTYDRKVIKLDENRIRKANLSTYHKKSLTEDQTDQQHLQ